MNKQQRTIAIPLIIFAIILLAAVVFGVIQLIGALQGPGGTAANTPPATAQATSSGAVLTEAAPAGTLDPTITAEMDQIQGQVSAIRGLQVTRDVPRRLLTTAQLTDTVTNDFLKNYTPEDAARDSADLSLLGLLPADFDLLSFYKKLYSEQIAGYYDDQTKEMFVISDAGFTGMEKSTYAHEFTHALQDQHFDFKGKLNYNEDSCKADSERCAAIQSLIEGDATLAETAWLQNYATQQDIQDIQAYYQNYQSPVFDAAPAFMQVDFLFAYQQGYNFVQALYNQGGFDAINTAFTTQVPVSTEQILHPDRYPADTPIPVNLPDVVAALGGAWESVESDVVGEWYTYLILAKGENPAWRLQDTIAQDAAAGWGGDAYTILQNPDSGESALAVRYTWDNKAEALAALDAFRNYSALRFGIPDSNGLAGSGSRFSQLITEGDLGFTWLVAESAQTLSTMAAQFGR